MNIANGFLVASPPFWKNPSDNWNSANGSLLVEGYAEIWLTVRTHVYHPEGPGFNSQNLQLLRCFPIPGAEERAVREQTALSQGRCYCIRWTSRLSDHLADFYVHICQLPEIHICQFWPGSLYLHFLPWLYYCVRSFNIETEISWPASYEI